MRIKHKELALIFIVLIAYLAYKPLNIEDRVNRIAASDLPPDHCIVEKVVDGDTIRCTFPDRSTKIRLLAIDASETTFGKNECYGEEATDWLKNKILNKRVRLQFDKEEPTYGNYGRLLAYICIDGSNVNFELLREGYVKALTKYPIHRYSKEDILRLERYSRSNNLGLWGNRY